MNAKVSIVIPTHNRAMLLAETMASVRAQTYSDWECIVVDDASQDQTAFFLADLAKVDPRVISLRNNSNAGPSACRNTGIQTARGEYILFLDSDDLLAPFLLEDRIKTLLNNTAMDYVAAPKILFSKEPHDKNGFMGAEIVSKEIDLDRFIIMDYPWAISGPLWRRRAIEKNGHWQDVRCFEDVEYHIRALCNKLPYVKLDEPDWFVRIGDMRGSLSQQAMSNRSIFDRHNMLWKIDGLVSAAGLMNTRRGELLWATMLRDALKCAKAQRKEQADSLMSQVCNSHLCAHAKLPDSLVRLLITMQPYRIPAAVLRRLIIRLMPAHTRFALNPYMLKTGFAPAHCRAMTWAKAYSYNAGA